jgi:hypothetical protein
MTGTRRFALVLLALAALLSGCGGGNGGGSSKGDLGDSLGYLPKDAALVVTFETDTTGGQYKNIDRILGKFPFGGQVKNQLRQMYARTGRDYDRDVQPMTGNPVVIGSADTKTLGRGDGRDALLIAWKTRDEKKLRETFSAGNQQKVGTIEGADAYEAADGFVSTVKGDQFVGAYSRPLLAAALKNHGGDGQMKEGDLNAPFAGLPADPIMRVYGDAQALLESSPKTATARQVKWVGGLRKFAATVSIEGDGVTLDGRVNTEGVGPQDLPIAAGDASPALARFGDYSVGQRNLAQTIHFAEATAAKADPQGFADYAKRKQAFGKKLKIDPDRDLIDQLSGDATLAGGLDGSWAIRSAVRDPAAMKATLAKMANAGRIGKSTLSRSDGLIKSTGDGTPAYFGMVGDVFVAAPTPDGAKQLAAVSPAPVQGARGALVLLADGEAIAKSILQRSGQGGAVSLFTGPIGDVTGYVTAAPGGLRAHAKLKVE